MLDTGMLSGVNLTGMKADADTPIEPVAYSRRQAAQAFGVDVTTIDKWIKHGRLKSVRIGGRVFIGRSALEELLKDQ